MSRVRLDRSPAEELHRLKVIHRSCIRVSRVVGNRSEQQAAARVVRRWMRKVRRASR